MKQITKAEFDDVLAAHSHLVIKYSADWCSTCQEVQPKLEQVEQNSDIPFYMVDVDNDPELKERARIKAIPMTLFYKEGKISSFIYGDTTVEKLEQKLRMLTA